MAKRNGKKTTAYTRYRNSIVSYINRQYKKYGVMVEVAVPKTENQLRKAGVSGKELRQHTNQLKKLHKVLGDVPAVDYWTGEIGTPNEFKQERKKERKQEKKKKEPKKPKKKEPDYPDGGDIIYTNVVEEFIQRLSEPVTENYTNFNGKIRRRSANTIATAERSRTTLLSLTLSVRDEIGESALGWRLQQVSEKIDTLLAFVLYGSQSDAINSACTELATYIKGGALSMQDLQDLGEQSEYNEDWSDPE